MKLLVEKPLLGTQLFFLSFQKKMTTQEVEASLLQMDMQLVCVDSHYTLVERMRDAFKCKRPLVFAGNKYIFSFGKVGFSEEKPNPYWSEDCIFVAVKLNL